MSQTVQQVAGKELWVLVSQLKENADSAELEKIAPQVLDLIDSWTKNGKFIWSGPFGNETGGMAIFEGTQNEANQFAENYGKICSNILNYYTYKWDILWGSK